MPDISMCTNATCTLRESCYRFLALPSMLQSFARFTQDKDGECAWQWPIDENEIQHLKRKHEQAKAGR